jgi:transposase
MSFGKPLQLRGQSWRSLPYAGKSVCTTGVEWFTVGVFAIETVFAMQLITILNQCHHFRGFVYERARFSPRERTTIEVQVRPRKGSTAICSACHQSAPSYDHLSERRFEFIPLWGFLVFLLYRMRRVNCRTCGIVVEEVPWATGKHQLTKVYMQFLAHWARQLSWKETAEAFHTSWEKVCHAVEYVVSWGLEHRTLGPLQALGVDEIQYAKGHKYLTLVYQIDANLTRLLWVGKERTVETFEGFFALIGQQLASQIEFVCSDMWRPYLRVIREKCSQALHILDRFHIVAKMNKALDDVRAAESRKMAQEGHEPLLKKSRWCVLKRRENLTSQQRFRLRDLLRYNLQTVRAYLLKEDFQQFWEYDSPAWAAKFLDEWCRQTLRSRIEPMKTIARMLRAHRDLILNYFKAKKQFSSGVVEGLNNKAKVTMRKSYGFRTFRITELALYHSLGKLPEPELTHEFF